MARTRHLIFCSGIEKYTFFIPDFPIFPSYFTWIYNGKAIFP